MFITGKNSLGTLIGLAATLGLATGFAIPLASSYQSSNDFQPKRVEAPKVAVLEIAPLTPPLPFAAAASADRDSEIARLTARNRRLEVLLATLRQRNNDAPKP